MTHRPQLTTSPLTERQAQTLQAVQACPSGVSATAVAVALGVSRNYALAILRALRDRGLIVPTLPGSHASVWLTTERAAVLRAKAAPQVSPIRRMVLRRRLIASVFDLALAA